MYSKECVAMILGKGRGEQLGELTRYYSKSVVYFGGNHRIIDFVLNNCSNSGIDTIGLLSQYFSTDLHTYINNIYDWKPEQEGIYHLIPEHEKLPYTGTADAVYRNTEFIDRFDPEYVLLLPGDHIYKMDYKKMIDFHRKSGADATIASTAVPIKETKRFTIINAEPESSRVYGFEEKPCRPKSNLASMGIYVFNWSILKKYLLHDSSNAQSRHDFDHNILPEMLFHGASVNMYQFYGYWRDVDTLNNLRKANIDQVNGTSSLQLEDDKWGVLQSYNMNIPNTISGGANINQSIVPGNCSIFGKVDHSVLSDSVIVGSGSEVVNSIIMPGVYIGNNVKIYNAIIGTRVILMDHTSIGLDYGSDFFVNDSVCDNGISLVAPWLQIIEGTEIQKNSQVTNEKLKHFYFSTMGNPIYSKAI